MRKLLGRICVFVLLVAPVTLAALWTCHPAALAAWAIYTLEPVKLSPSDWEDPTRLLELRRQVQRHFLSHSVYIPMEDIITSSPTDGAPGSATPASLLMQKACGRGRLFIWIPFKFQLPVNGEKVIEWCWKPQTKDA